MTTKAIPQPRVSLAMLQAESLLSMVMAADGPLLLHKPAMRQFKRRGFNRTDLDAAIDRLVKDGHITALGTSEGVMLALTKEAGTAAGE